MNEIVGIFPSCLLGRDGHRDRPRSTTVWSRAAAAQAQRASGTALRQGRAPTAAAHQTRWGWTMSGREEAQRH
jgi:hypothetical protein